MILRSPFSCAWFLNVFLCICLLPLFRRRHMTFSLQDLGIRIIQNGFIWTCDITVLSYALGIFSIHLFNFNLLNFMINGTVNISYNDENITFQHILQPEPFDAKTDDSHMVLFDTNSIVDCNRETQASFSPMIVTQPFVVASTTLSIRLFVPLAKLSHSNTPTGPFHTICLALATAAAFALELSGPQSKPCRERSSPW